MASSAAASNQASDSTDSMRTPGVLWPGMGLILCKRARFNRRVMVCTRSETENVPYSGVRNAASRDIFAVGGVALGGTIKEADEITLKVDTTDYKYKILKDDTFDIIVNALVKAINGSNDGKGRSEGTGYAEPGDTVAGADLPDSRRGTETPFLFRLRFRPMPCLPPPPAALT